MKERLLGIFIAFLVVAVFSVTSLESNARNSKAATADTTVVGYISDGTCGLKHMSVMGDDKSCTLACVKQSSKFVLADRDHKRVYQLDKAGQEKVREFAGQKVKVTGRVSGRSIRVTSIEPA